MSVEDREKWIAVDVDGVLLDIEKHWLETALEQTGRIPQKLNDSYNFHKRYDITPEESKKIWEALNWSDFPAYKEAVEAMDLLASKGFKILIVTAINQSIVQDRMENLTRHGIHFDKIVACSYSRDKKKVFEEYNVLAVIDDVASVINMSTRSDIDALFYIDRGYTDQGSKPSFQNVHHVPCVLTAANKIVEVFA